MVGRAIEDEVILVPIRNNVGDLQNIYVLNKIGGFIWNCIDGDAKGYQIIEKIVTEFEVTSAEAESDLSSFIQQLEEIGAITTS